MARKDGGFLDMSNAMESLRGKTKKAVGSSAQLSRSQFNDATRTPGGPQGKSNLRSDGKGGYTTIPDKPAPRKSVGKKPMPVKRGPRRGK